VRRVTVEPAKAAVANKLASAAQPKAVRLAPTRAAPVGKLAQRERPMKAARACWVYRYCRASWVEPRRKT